MKAVLLVTLMMLSFLSCRKKGEESPITNGTVKDQIREAQKFAAISADEIRASYQAEVEEYIIERKKEFLEELEESETFIAFIRERKEQLVAEIQKDLNVIDERVKGMEEIGVKLEYDNKVRRRWGLRGRNVTFQRNYSVKHSGWFRSWDDHIDVFSDYFSSVEAFIEKYPLDLVYSPEVEKMMTKACFLDQYLARIGQVEQVLRNLPCRNDSE